MNLTLSAKGVMFKLSIDHLGLDAEAQGKVIVIGVVLNLTMNRILEV